MTTCKRYPRRRSRRMAARTRTKTRTTTRTTTRKRKRRRMMAPRMTTVETGKRKTMMTKTRKRKRNRMTKMGSSHPPLSPAQLSGVPERAGSRASKRPIRWGPYPLGFLTLVETAYLFGIGKESILEANRSRARMAKAWERPGKSRKSSRRAAAVAASVAISSFVSTDMDVDGGDSPSEKGATGKRRSSRGEGGGGSADKRQR